MHRDLKPVPLRGCSVGAFWVGKTMILVHPKKDWNIYHWNMEDGTYHWNMEKYHWNMEILVKISLEYGISCKNIIEIWKTFDERSLLVTLLLGPKSWLRWDEFFRLQ